MDPRRRRSRHLTGAATGIILLVLINVAPGWRTVPVLTGDTVRVLPFVNLAVLTGLLVNLVLAGTGRPRVFSAGNVVASAAGLVAAIRVWQVFPFDLPQPWALGVRTVVGVFIALDAVGVLAHTASLVVRPAGR